MTGAIGFVSFLFFLTGLSSVLIAILVPLTIEYFHLNFTTASLVFLSLYLAYFLSSPIAGKLFCRQEVSGMRWGIGIGALGCLIIGTAASFSVFLFGIFLLGIGIATLQVTANPYILFISDCNQGRRLSFTQAFTSVGMIAAPLYASRTFLSDQKLFFPFIALAALWGGAVLLSLFLNFPPSLERVEKKRSVFPLEGIVIIGMVGIALAVGIEVATGTYLIPFLMHPETFDLPIDTAGEYAALFWVGFLIGRLAGSALLKWISPERLLTLHIFFGLIFSLTAVFSSGIAATASVLLLGYCTSILFPVIFSWTLARTRSNPTAVSGLLCMANLGGALVPLTQGAIIDQFDIHLSYLVPASCFVLLIAIPLWKHPVEESDAAHASG